MSYVTTQLDGESGIQYKGVQDKTNLNQVGNLANMLMLVEDIPRGRLDQAMTITSANLTPLLGRDKGNLYLQAVEDALKEGVPSVQVFRLNTNGDNNGGGNGASISCVSASNTMYFASFSQGWDIEIDGQRYASASQPINNFITNNFSDKLIADADGSLNIINISSQNIRIKFIPVSPDATYTANLSTNLTFMAHDNGSLTFCLAPQTNTISCDGATNTCKLVLNHNASNSTELLNAVTDAFTFQVNGLFFEYIPSYLERSIELIGDVANPGSFSRAEVTFKSNSDENVRLKLIKQPESFTLNVSNTNNNTTLMGDMEGNFTVCLAPNTPSCTPVGAELLEVPYQSTANTYFAQYRLNGGPIQRAEYTTDAPIAPSDLALSLFGQIQDEHEVMLFAMDGGTHICPFYAYHFQYEVRAASSSLNPSEDRATTLDFIMNPNIEGIDAIQLYFGKDVTLHACSYMEWPAS